MICRFNGLRTLQNGDVALTFHVDPKHSGDAFNVNALIKRPIKMELFADPDAR